MNIFIRFFFCHFSHQNQAKDPQADVLPKIKETFRFAEFRKVLNDVNDVFDEDTQRGTDLIIR